MRKVLAVALVMCLLATVLPAQTISAQAHTGLISGMEIESELFVRDSYVSEVTTGPVLAQGEHERWIDRIGNLPEFAKEFYSWLEDNANPTGALADPTKGEEIEGLWVHQVETVSGSVPFTYNTGDSVTDLAYEASVADLGNLPYVLADYIFATYAAFDRDHPEVFWLTGNSICGSSISYSYSGGGGQAVAEYTMYMYFYLQTDSFDLRAAAYQDPQLIATGIEQRESHIDRLLTAFPYEDTVYNQVVYLNDVLTKTNAYNSAVVQNNIEGASPAAWECISALSGSVGVDGPVCEGYARAMNVLCDRVGIPCVLVEGIGNDTAHMWNYVKLDDSWYAVDVTFNDPAKLSALDAPESGSEGTSWIGLGSTSDTILGKPFSQTHIVNNVSYKNGLNYSNGPALSETGYSVVSENYMDLSLYRSAEGYTAPVRQGYVFAGWFLDEEMTQSVPRDMVEGWAYAKFVDEKVLSVKFQTTFGTTADSTATDLRLLTSVDSLNLRSVGFAVTVGERTQLLSSRTVYSKINAGGTVVSDAASVFGADSAYFVAYTLTEVPQSMFEYPLTVVPCWETLDGTTVQGLPRTLTISETYS